MSTHPLADWMAHESTVPHQRTDLDDELAIWRRHHPTDHHVHVPKHLHLHLPLHLPGHHLEVPDDPLLQAEHVTWSTWAHREDDSMLPPG